MKMKSQKSLTNLILLLIGVTGYTLSGLNWSIAITAWFAPIFLLYFTRNSKWKGLIVFFLAMSLSAAISKTAENQLNLLIITITTGLSHGVINTIPYIIDKLLSRNDKKFYGTLIFPSAVVLVEYLLILLVGLWGNQSISQYSSFNLIQITSIVGIYGITFLIAWFASVANWVIKNKYDLLHVRKGIIIYGSVFFAVLLFGGIRTSLFPSKSEVIKVAAIIGETDLFGLFEKMEDDIVELSKNYDLDIPESVFSTTEAIELQIKKTDEALNNNARIVVWSEMPLILDKLQVEPLLRRVQELCVNNEAYVLVAFLEKNAGTLPKPFNNKSILITPDGQIAWDYSKSNLSPLEKLISNKGNSTIPFIDTDYGRLGNVICYDLDMPGYMSQAGKNAIDIMLVPAFDWEEVTPYHSNMAAFTAIQFGFSIIRSNGKGVVAFYDYQGNTIAKMNTFFSDTKISYADIPIKSTTTVYSIVGDIFVYILILFLLFILGLRILRKEAVS